MVNVKPVTLYDVAEYAGVSYQTVSRVVNRPATFQRKRGKSEAAMAERITFPTAWHNNWRANSRC
ncbi:MAG: LacI family DNA-binding transcriptional regulator [Escherichia coli]